MSKETLGFVKLEWTCPKCGSRNPGPEKTCMSCGAPQPENVQFVQAAGEEASQDAELGKIAAKGPDIHCPFCGTRNPADAAICSQCGGDLKEGVKRETGRVIGAYTAEPVKQIECPNCSALNPESAISCSKCGASLQREPEAPSTPPASSPQKQRQSNLLIYGGIAVLALLCICGIAGLIYASAPRQTEVGSVHSVEWQTSVAIEALRPVIRQAWQDQIPQDADVGNCVDKVYSVVSSEPSSGNYSKVCGTPYTIDTGSGVGQVVQDCEFEVLEPYCEYSATEWQIVDEASLSGRDLNPLFANPSLSGDQRLGAQDAEYVIVFVTDKGRFTYHPGTKEEFHQYQIDSEWNLKINSFGQIVSVEPSD